MEREILRNELIRILAERGFDRNRGANGNPENLIGHNFNNLLLRNIQMMSMSNLNREFNENDYEMLSALDGSGRRGNERT